MLTLDILISVKDAHIVRIKDALPEERSGVKYIICFQYSNESFLQLIPPVLESYSDVTLIKSPLKGLSLSRNMMLEKATSDLVYFMDDDTRFLPYTIDNMIKTFEQNPNIDIAFFQAQTYTGKTLREYPTKKKEVVSFRERMNKLACETVYRRTSIQGVIWYNEDFGVGSSLFSCYEQQIFLNEAYRKHLKMIYFPLPIVLTSALYSPRMLLVDKHVQRAFGALLGQVYGKKAVFYAFVYASVFAKKSQRQILQLINTFVQGIFIWQRKHATKHR